MATSIKKQAGMRLPEDLLLKMKVIASKEFSSVTDVANAACTQYVSEWETKNGKIKPAEIERAKAAGNK